MNELWGTLAHYSAALIGGYLLGSIPDTYLLTRLFAHKDLRRSGTGVLSVTNTYRTAGLFPAVLATLWHIALGAVVVLLAWWLLPEAGRPLPAWVLSWGLPFWLTPPLRLAPAFALMGAFLGQNWPLYLPRGNGRGRTCWNAGMVLISPLVFAFDGIFWFLGWGLGRRPGVGSILTNGALPFLMYLFTGSWVMVGLGVAFAAIFMIKLGQGGHEWTRQVPAAE